MTATQRKTAMQVFVQDSQSHPVSSTEGKLAGSNYLRIALKVVGCIFIFGIYAFTIAWPSGWTWQPGHSHYLDMILGVYATLGVFLLIASRDPIKHLSLIWFAVWSSVVHAGIMTVQALMNPEHAGHLVGDVPALLIVAAVLAVLTPRSSATVLTASHL